MSLSREENRARADRALASALAAIGDHAYTDVLLEVKTDPRLAGIDMVTWKLLESEAFVSSEGSMIGAPVVQLTRWGWLEALRITGELESPVFQERCSTLVAFLKSLVKGRDDEAFLEWTEIAAGAGLPQDWVWSAVHADLLDTIWPGRGYGVRVSGRYVRVPLTFGLTL